MRYYFEDVDKQKDLEKILESWIHPHTPYRHHCGVKGMGCDCIYFVARVLEEMGVLKWRKDIIPDNPRDSHMHNTRELLAESIEREMRVERVELSGLMNGDIILYHYGQACSHAAIFLGESIYHSVDRSGVVKTPFSDLTFRKRAQYAYRILR